MIGERIGRAQAAPLARRRSSDAAAVANEGRNLVTSFIQKLTGSDAKGIALRFVLMFGVISLFADFTYEGCS